MNTSSVELNGHTVARILIDPSPEDPRKINAEGDAAEGFGVYELVGTMGNDSEVPRWARTFIEIVSNHGGPVAHRAMAILRSMGATIPGYVGTRSYEGYTQSEWAHLIISGPTEEQAESYYKTYAAWARGDVYGITLERKCPITGGWFTLPEEDLAIWGIYWSGDEDFAEEIRSIAEEHWDIEAQPLSEEGESLQKRRQLEAIIGENIERFELLATAEGESISNGLATKIFKLYADLVEEYSNALEEN